MTQIQRQIPNILTIIRIPLAFLCAYFAIFLDPKSLSFSLVLFLLASITDFLDGHIARKWNIVSNFGKIIDPIADKMLILGVLSVFTYNGIIPFILTLAIALREIGLTVVRLLLLPKKVVLAARFSGKIKTFSQIGALIAIYLLLIFKSPLQSFVSMNVINNIIFMLVIWLVSITLYSGVEFLFFNKKALKKL